jgi:hypothetical protein
MEGNADPKVAEKRAELLVRRADSAKQNLEELQKGKKVFSRELLEYVDRVWSSGEGKLVIHDVNGNPHEYDLKPHREGSPPEETEGYAP